MVFKNLPLPVQNLILDHLDFESLIKVKTLDYELSPLIQEKVFDRLLRDGLQYIIRENQPEKLIYWKRNVYDVIPFGDKRRQVILASLFYLLGKYPKSNIGEYTYIFNSVIDCEFMLYKCLGLSHQEGYSFPFRDYFRISISEEAKKDELVTNDLFEEITGFKMRKAELESPEVCEIKA